MHDEKSYHLSQSCVLQRNPHGHPASPAAGRLFRPLRRLPQRHGQPMILALALISLALFVYLLYSLLRPEDF
ncbi:K(+)-transporting ATPase subunit F (plasmid) [Deinococcus radiodurans]|uniref:K(+)-transporting ATPase subunit F n=1 Tax=Deinococcus radiodurans (strain ATCC 13939 / DSM 20539 / JCM 16871 / CCUG 27074 / LMG 4051 / NBRC 15346 / NCIMB 9279 / VKM B-1422 / R1) TaxID=243230 RepID=Q9RZN8_DEIRA|nr:hypothetical protein DR_B0085 [Deinococcus radiodurans R1 = ATCC 13939 = DSM 20539]QEM73262.1 K(+)-transporting ATPase subunit F [Deinococcus radiodurans]ANC73272.1 hypothetical protein A2G07_15630 [Deinococcus radiodurans R1 = ATCC 13939 = DSM 20539]QIP30653.1 K(+)-transporting ATPase subunit F [Deinococcus radiodurans]QIP33533.1 K(+)-transporting ATPase subunit F [Deinococcus radiodurans]